MVLRKPVSLALLRTPYYFYGVFECFQCLSMEKQTIYASAFDSSTTLPIYFKGKKKQLQVRGFLKTKLGRGLHHRFPCLKLLVAV